MEVVRDDEVFDPDQTLGDLMRERKRVNVKGPRLYKRGEPDPNEANPVELKFSTLAQERMFHKNSTGEDVIVRVFNPFQSFKKRDVMKQVSPELEGRALLGFKFHEGGMFFMSKDFPKNLYSRKVNRYTYQNPVVTESIGTWNYYNYLDMVTIIQQILNLNSSFANNIVASDFSTMSPYVQMLGRQPLFWAIRTPEGLTHPTHIDDFNNNPKWKSYLSDSETIELELQTLVSHVAIAPSFAKAIECLRLSPNLPLKLLHDTIFHLEYILHLMEFRVNSIPVPMVKIDWTAMVRTSSSMYKIGSQNWQYIEEIKAANPDAVEFKIAEQLVKDGKLANDPRLEETVAWARVHQDHLNALDTEFGKLQLSIRSHKLVTQITTILYDFRNRTESRRVPYISQLIRAGKEEKKTFERTTGIGKDGKTYTSITYQTKAKPQVEDLGRFSTGSVEKDAEGFITVPLERNGNIPQEILSALDTVFGLEGASLILRELATQKKDRPRSQSQKNPNKFRGPRKAPIKKNNWNGRGRKNSKQGGSRSRDPSNTSNRSSFSNFNNFNKRGSNKPWRGKRR